MGAEWVGCSSIRWVCPQKMLIESEWRTFASRMTILAILSCSQGPICDDDLCSHL